MGASDGLLRQLKSAPPFVWMIAARSCANSPGLLDRARASEYERVLLLAGRGWNFLESEAIHALHPAQVVVRAFRGQDPDEVVVRLECNAVLFPVAEGRWELREAQP